MKNKIIAYPDHRMKKGVLFKTRFSDSFLNINSSTIKMENPMINSIDRSNVLGIERVLTPSRTSFAFDTSEALKNSQANDTIK